MRLARHLGLGVALTGMLVSGVPAQPARTAPASPIEEMMVTDNPPGHAGSRIVVALRSEPKTLNPAMAMDVTSREVIECLSADLIHINRASQKTEPALAKS